MNEIRTNNRQTIGSGTFVIRGNEASVPTITQPTLQVRPKIQAMIERSIRENHAVWVELADR